MLFGDHCCVENDWLELRVLHLNERHQSVRMPDFAPRNIMLFNCRSAPRSQNCSCVPLWLGPDRGKHRVRALLCASSQSTQFSEAKRRPTLQWARILASLPVLCASENALRTAPLVQMNCTTSLMAVHRQSCRHAIITAPTSVLGRWGHSLFVA
jgi:hypothetical protein